MNWLIPENELDREQRKILDAIMTQKGNIQIVGFPGSGKTVLLLYAAKLMKERNPCANILFVEFTHSLIQMIETSIREFHGCDIPVVTYYDFCQNYTNCGVFDCIFCDEIQDIPLKVIDMLKKHAKRVIVAGDPKQSIYSKDPKWNWPTCSQSDLRDRLNVEPYRLSVIHRLSKFVISAVDKFLPDMHITSGRHSMVKTHPKIRIWKADNKKMEVDAIMSDAENYFNIGESVGILLPSHHKILQFANIFLKCAGKPEWKAKRDKYRNNDYGKLNEHFEKYQIPIRYVANGYGSFSNDKSRIVLTTYHSSKGLDFDRVYLPFCNNNDNPNELKNDITLFMVAMTRSRRDLIISYSKMLNNFVYSFKDDCSYKKLTSPNYPQFPTDVETESKKEEKVIDLFGW